MDIDFRILYQSISDSIESEYVFNFLRKYDCIYFKNDDKNLMILKNDFPLIEIDIESTQGNIKTLQIGAGYVMLNK